MRNKKLILSGAAGAAVLAIAAWLLADGGDARPTYRLAKVEAGAIVAAVTATGKVDAVTTVVVGSQLSGQIRELPGDFNMQVKTGQVLAKLDDDMIQAKLDAARSDVLQAQANVATMEAQLERAKADIANARAQLVRAEVAVKDGDRELRRARELKQRGAGAEAAVDRAETTFETAKAQERASAAALVAAQAQQRVAEAQLEVARAQLAQRAAAQQQVKVELDRSVIRAPIDGVVVARNVDIGTTVAASLQAPVLFSIAEDLHRMQVLATVDEADIGRVRDGQDVSFTVNAHPSDTFRGKVVQIRLAPQVVSNVVTYTVVVGADNPQLKLLPGMTATVRVIVAQRDGATKVPNAALRYRPPGRGEAPAPASAATSSGGQGSGQGGGQRQGPPDYDAMQRRLTEELKLSAAQQKSLAEVFQATKAASAGAMSLPQEERRARFQEIRRQTQERIAALLEPPQRERYQEIVAAQQGGGPARPGQTGQVYVLGADGKPAPVAVRVGVSDGSFTEILGAALKPGQEVVIGGGAAPGGSAPAGVRLGF